ncbi:MAG: glycosyltransferase family 39 protein, partial [Arcobacteraceae bacterium]|nr:glycosyltransferase family 39 protein [Arcobacteraceae bacterium]
MSEEKIQSISRNHWILILLVLFIFILVTRSPVSHTGSDPRSSLLLSQVLIEDQSIKLDKYKDENYGVIHKKNEHYYYYLPIGTSISSIPFVWIKTKALDNDMNNRQHDAVAQKQIAGIVAVLIFLLLYSISSMYFTAGVSITASFVFWMGTSLSSTLGQALWSQDFASLYALLAIFLMLKIVKENKNIYWIFLGLALFMAYLTRPTMSLLSITVILYIFFNHKRYIAIKTASLVGFLLGIFVLFSLSEFNQLLPDYYLPKRLESETFWTALYGNLFSPARGLFIFSPILLIFFLNTKGTYKIFKDDKTLLIIAVWVVLHLIIISKF